MKNVTIYHINANEEKFESVNASNVIDNYFTIDFVLEGAQQLKLNNDYILMLRFIKNSKLMMNNSKISLVVSGYLRENKILLCFCDIIYNYFPHLLLIKDGKYDELANKLTINNLGRCFSDIGFNCGIYEIIAIMETHPDRYFCFGFCTNINTTDKSVDGMYLCSPICDTEYDVYIDVDGPVGFFSMKNGKREIYKEWEQTDEDKIYKEFKWEIDCDKGTISFYCDDKLFDDNEKCDLSLFEIDKNKTYYPVIEAIEGGEFKGQLIINRL